MFGHGDSWNESVYNPNTGCTTTYTYATQYVFWIAVGDDIMGTVTECPSTQDIIINFQ